MSKIQGLDYLLFKTVKFSGIKKLAKGDFKAVAKFFESDDSWVFAFKVENALDCGLRNRRQVAEAVWRDSALVA